LVSLLQKLIVRSTCFGHHYTHHLELKSYTDGCCMWYLELWFTDRWSGVELWVLCPVCGMFLDWLCFVVCRGDGRLPVEKDGFAWPFDFHVLTTIHSQTHIKFKDL